MYKIGEIDPDIYRGVAKSIITREVIITKERIKHIMENHPNDYERFYSYFSEIVEKPDYIIESKKPNTELILKEIRHDNIKFKTILRLVVAGENTEYKNSIITFMKIDDKEWNRLLRNKKIIYKRE